MHTRKCERSWQNLRATGQSNQQLNNPSSVTIVRVTTLNGQ